MPKITDQEPITARGKIIYQNELDRVKRVYGFGADTIVGTYLDPEERAKRNLARQRNRINRAR